MPIVVAPGMKRYGGCVCCAKSRFLQFDGLCTGTLLNLILGFKSVEFILALRDDTDVIYIHHRKVNGVWYAAAIEGEKVFATAFSSDEKEVLQSLLESLPYDASFQFSEKPNQLSENLLTTLKLIFEGKNVSANFRLEMNHLSNYARKVLECVSTIPIGYVTSYGAIAKAAGGSPRAVGRIMAINPFVPLIPCHRVVRANLTFISFQLFLTCRSGNKGNTLSLTFLLTEYR